MRFWQVPASGELLHARQVRGQSLPWNCRLGSGMDGSHEIEKYKVPGTPIGRLSDVKETECSHAVANSYNGHTVSRIKREVLLPTKDSVPINSFLN